jgi:hypothetical protein
MLPPPRANTPPVNEEHKEYKKPPERGEETERIFNIRGGKLVLTFCSMGGLVNVQIIRGGDYGLTNAELGRGTEDELQELGAALITLSSAMKTNKQVEATVGG